MAAESLIIDFWDVGQGDASVIRLPDNRLILIDVGPRGSPIVDWMAERPRAVHALVLTHNDEDHAGALPSLIKLPGVTFTSVYMLLDRDKRSDTFRNIWRPVRHEELKGKLRVIGLARDAEIWASGSTRLTAVYPSFSEGVEATRPNETSAIVCLTHNGEQTIVWPGDAPMQIVAEKCSAATPTLLHGPHHGGPVDKKSPNFRSYVEALLPERVFISVSTKNRYNLPSRKYLALQSTRGCRVVCTEITRECDNHHVLENKPVLQGAMLLGLRAPRSGVSCRGCMRLRVNNGTILPDPFDTAHAQRVSTLRRPICKITP